MLYPEKVRRDFWEVVLWAGVVAAALVPRIVVLLCSETHLDADESVVGLMAMRAAHGGGLSPFFWGQHYGGGHTIEAALASVVFRIAGPSAAAVQMVPALFATGVVVIAFAFMRELYGRRTAFWTVAVLSLSTPFLKSSLKADGYMETIFLCFLAVWLARRLESCIGQRRSIPAFGCSAALGAVCGAAWWSYDFSLVFTAALALVLLRRRLVRGFAHLFLMFICFVTGAAPLLIDNMLHGMANAGHLASALSAKDVPFALHVFYSAQRLVSVQLPAFMSRECVHIFVYPPPWSAWAYYGVALLCAAALAQRRGRSMMPGAWVLAPALYLMLYCATGISGALSANEPWLFTQSLWTLGKSPRYLLPIEPYLSLMLVAGLGIMLKSRHTISRYMGFLAAATLLVALVFGVADILSENTIYEGNIKTNPRSVPAVVRFLERNKIDCVHTTYFIKWRILFESRERVRAVDLLILRQQKEGYDYYERLGCDPNKPPAFVFHKDSPLRFEIARQLRPARDMYNTPVLIGDHIIIYPKSDKQLKRERPSRPPSKRKIQLTPGQKLDEKYKRELEQELMREIKRRANHAATGTIDTGAATDTATPGAATGARQAPEEELP